MSKLYRQVVVSIAVSVIILLSTTITVYAWFTSNRIVYTDKVSCRSGTKMVDLYVSDTGGEDFPENKETNIVQLNKANKDKLMPVSTFDLKNFVYNDGTVEDMAVHFSKVSNEEYLYHGRVYLLAKAQGNNEKEKLALYLDNNSEKGLLFEKSTGYILNAVRLGLVFNEDETRIIRISDEQNYSAERKNNTVLNGELLSENQVIDSSGEKLQAKTDPSVLINKYMVDENGIALEGTEPLLIMDLNNVYVVDIYVYLEGCDPDCVDVLQLNSMSFHLSFYGVLTNDTYE